MIGQGRNVVVLILLLFAVAFVVAAGWKLRARIAALAVLSTLCFVGYNLMLALSYGFIFKPFQAESLQDYNRYIYSYYIGWFLIAVACLATALLPQLEKSLRTIREKDGPHGRSSAQNCAPPRWGLAGQGAVLVLAAAMLLRQGQLVLPQLSVLGFADSEFSDRRTIRAEAELVCSYLTPDDRVFFVSQGDNGERWFSAVFDFYPYLVDYSGVVSTMVGGGGELGPAGIAAHRGGPQTDLLPRLHRRRAGLHRAGQRLHRAVSTKNPTTFLCKATRTSSPMVWKGRSRGQTLLYRVTEDGFAPMEMEVTAS